MYIEAFTSHFSNIIDQRQTAKVTYPLEDILFVSLCAVIAGAEGWADIHCYADGHLAWFQKHGYLKEGVPADDTIARIISRIDPDEFSACFMQWMQAVHSASDGQLIAIDGKTLKRSYHRNDRLSTIHMVNAFACENKLVLGQLKTSDKSNEITAIPDLLQLLDIREKLVSIDAMGCQKSIAAQIVKQDGDYLLAVKSNQKSLHDAIMSAFSSVRKAPLSPLAIENKHGRVEARAYHVLSANELEGDFSEWQGLRSIGMAMSYRHCNGKGALTYRYYISSAELPEQKFADAVRSHWFIENSLHWVLDASMGEDHCQIYQNHAAENWSLLRKLSLNMLRSESSKGSIPMKQKRAWMKPEYLEEVLRAGFTSLLEI